MRGMVPAPLRSTACKQSVALTASVLRSRWRRRHCGHRVPRWAIGLCAASVLLLLAVLAVLTFTLIIPKVIDTLMADSTIEFEFIRLSKPGSSSLFLDAQGIKATPTGILFSALPATHLTPAVRQDQSQRSVAGDDSLIPPRRPLPRTAAWANGDARHHGTTALVAPDIQLSSDHQPTYSLTPACS